MENNSVPVSKFDARQQAEKIPFNAMIQHWLETGVYAGPGVEHVENKPVMEPCDSRDKLTFRA